MRQGQATVPVITMNRIARAEVRIDKRVPADGRTDAHECIAIAIYAKTDLPSYEAQGGEYLAAEFEIFMPEDVDNLIAELREKQKELWGGGE